MTKSLYDPAVELKGRMEGRVEGRIEGRIEGENKKALEVAIKLLQKGMSIEDIQEITTLSIQEIEKLRLEMLKH